MSAKLETIPNGNKTSTTPKQMNEMKLDMSMADHRKLLKKHEKIFVGVLSPEGEIIDYTNEDNRKPDEPEVN